MHITGTSWKSTIHCWMSAMQYTHCRYEIENWRGSYHCAVYIAELLIYSWFTSSCRYIGNHEGLVLLNILSHMAIQLYKAVPTGGNWQLITNAMLLVFLCYIVINKLKESIAYTQWYILNTTDIRLVLYFLACCCSPPPWTWHHSMPTGLGPELEWGCMYFTKPSTG